MINDLISILDLKLTCRLKVKGNGYSLVSSYTFHNLPNTFLTS